MGLEEAFYECPFETTDIWNKSLKWVSDLHSHQVNLISTVDGSTIKWPLLIKKRFVFTKEFNGQDGKGDLRMGES